MAAVSRCRKPPNPWTGDEHGLELGIEDRRKLQTFLNLFGDNPDMPLGMIAALVRVALNRAPTVTLLRSRERVLSRR
jgi:hypothetical protein